MKHIVFFLYMISLSSGFVALIVSLLLYNKYKIKTLKFYIFGVISASLISLVYTILIYFKIYFSDYRIYPGIVYLIFIVIAKGFLILVLPYATHSLLNKKMSAVREMLFILFTSIFIASIVLDIVFDKKIIIEIRDCVLLAFGYFQTIFVLINYKNIQNDDIKKGLKPALVLTIIFPIAVLIYMGLKHIPIISNTIPSGGLPYMIYFLLWNIFTLNKAANYFFFTTGYQHFKISDHFIKKYEITDREKEIIGLIHEGLNNLQIADKLFISHQTSRNHIYNIYRKTGATNRVELLNIIKDLS